MERTYKDGEVLTGVVYFTGIEVEHTPAHGMKTLFVSGLQPLENIVRSVEVFDCKHIYLGANQSFDIATGDELLDEEIQEIQDWDALLKSLLDADYWVTLDFDVKHVETVLEMSAVEKSKFIPMISVKLPYINQLGYNATIKLDDTDFEATNPGVWCHSVHELMDRNKFTNWDQYKDDDTL